VSDELAPGVVRNHPLQRAVRDAATSHVAFDRDVQLASYGSVRLGRAPTSRSF
jgi:hypothetical protein